jgi:hypothetical protein
MGTRLGVVGAAGSAGLTVAGRVAKGAVGLLPPGSDGLEAVVAVVGATGGRSVGVADIGPELAGPPPTSVLRSVFAWFLAVSLHPTIKIPPSTTICTAKIIRILKYRVDLPRGGNVPWGRSGFGVFIILSADLF